MRAKYFLENAKLVRETEKAFLVECEVSTFQGYTKAEFWFPKSQLDGETWEVKAKFLSQFVKTLFGKSLHVREEAGE